MTLVLVLLPLTSGPPSLALLPSDQEVSAPTLREASHLTPWVSFWQSSLCDLKSQGLGSGEIVSTRQVFMVQVWRAEFGFSGPMSNSA